jgi:hypothetical protein
MQKMIKALFVLLFTVPYMLTAQNVPKNQDPIWYTMMQDPKVNYHAAVKAYKDYWKDKKTPPNKDLRRTEEYKTYFSKMTVAERQEYERVFLLHKEFKYWMQNEEAWVQADGTLMPQAEREALIERQQAEQKAIEKKNGKN